MSNIPFVDIFFPSATGLSIHENDLIVTVVTKKLVKISYATFTVRDFLLKESQQLKPVLVQYKRIKGDIILSLPREFCIIREIEFPHTNIKELREALAYQLDSFIPFSNEDVYFDVHLLAHDRHNSKLLIVAVKKEELDGILSRLQAMDITPTRVIISSFAFLPLITDKSGSIAVINRNRDEYSYNTYENNNLVFSSIVKNEGEIAKYFKKRVPDEVFLVNSDKETVLNNGLNVPTQTMGRDSESYGAALYGISGYSCNLSLVKPSKRRLNPQMTFMSFLIGFLLLFIFLIPYIQKINNLAMIEKLDGKIMSLRKEVKVVEKIKKKMEALENTVNNVVEVKKDYVPRIEVVLELAKVLPQDAWAKTVKIDDNTFEIEGDAVSSTNLIPILDKSPLFSAVGFASPVTKTQGGREKFRIRGNINKQ